MTPDTDNYQQDACCGEATVRFDTDETLTWGFDIGDEGLSNDLCMIWKGGPSGFSTHGMGALVGESRLYACDSMWTSRGHADPATVSGCTLVEIHVHPTITPYWQWTWHGYEYRFDTDGQIDWDSGVTSGNWQSFPVPVGVRSRYYAWQWFATNLIENGNAYEIRVSEFEFYFAEASADDSRGDSGGDSGGAALQPAEPDPAVDGKARSVRQPR